MAVLFPFLPLSKPPYFQFISLYLSLPAQFTISNFISQFSNKSASSLSTFFFSLPLSQFFSNSLLYHQNFLRQSSYLSVISIESFLSLSLPFCQAVSSPGSLVACLSFPLGLKGLIMLRSFPIIVCQCWEKKTAHDDVDGKEEKKKEQEEDEAGKEEEIHRSGAFISNPRRKERFAIVSHWFVSRETYEEMKKRSEIIQEKYR